MSYAPSNKIKIFPVAKPREYDVGSRLFYENNTTNMINQLLDRNGFIISPQPNNVINSGSTLIFNLGGYRIEMKIPSDNISDYTYAKLDFSGDSNELKQDNNIPEYEGIIFSDTEPSAGVWIRLLDNNGTNFVTCADSYVKFDQNSLIIDEIDPGDLG